MTDQSQEKDYFWYIVAGTGVLAIAGVLAFKNMDIRNEHVAGKGYSPETTASQDAQVLSKHKNLNNDILGQVK